MAKKDKFAEKHQAREPKNFDQLFLEYSQIVHALEFGELTPELEEKLLANQEDFEDKLAGIYHVISKLDAARKGYLKDNVAQLSMRMKHYEKQSAFLKERAMLIVETFGHENKLITEKINCSIVSLDVLDTDEEYDKRLDHLVECIKFNAVDDTINDTENQYFSASINISNMSCGLAAKIYKLISEDQDVIDQVPEIRIGITADRKGILEALKVHNTLEDGKQEQFKSYIEMSKSLDQSVIEDVIAPERKDFEIKGASIGTSKYPKFS